MTARQGRSPKVRGLRLTPIQLAELLAPHPAPVGRIVRALRAVITAAAPAASEAVKFGCLCYYLPEAAFGCIGGNICMIEPRHRASGGVAVSFLLGAELADPAGLLRGAGKAKRYVPVADVAGARSSRLRSLIRASYAAASQAAKYTDVQ